MADIEQQVDELERSYTELQERMSDSSVYNDRREAASVGRRLKELELPYRLIASKRICVCGKEAEAQLPKNPFLER